MRLADYVAGHEGELASLLDAVRVEAGDPALDTAGCIALLCQWHDADRKIAPLKALQGLIWEQGYASGAIRGHVYADAAAGLRRWHQRGLCWRSIPLDRSWRRSCCSNTAIAAI
jgi:enolase-phosphatase E1